LVTVSASFHLLSRTRESLAGRTKRHNVWPLSLFEITGHLDPGTPAGRTMKRRSAFERMLVWGSYPEVVTSHHPQVILSQLLTSFVLRDASDRFRITRPDAFRLALRLGAGQIGDMVNYSEYAGILGISQPTVREYLGIMEETHIIRQIRPFIGGRRAELTSAPKLFFIDNGLRNSVSGGFEPLEPLEHRNDIGKLMENWIFSELHKRYPQPGDIRYWRTKGGAEMDFVLEPRPGLLVGIECKAQKHNHPRLSRSARSFIKAHEPVQQLIFTRGQPCEEQMGKTLIRYLPAESVSEALSSLTSLTSI